MITFAVQLQFEIPTVEEKKIVEKKLSKHRKISICKSIKLRRIQKIQYITVSFASGESPHLNISFDLDSIEFLLINRANYHPHIKHNIMATLNGNFVCAIDGDGHRSTHERLNFFHLTLLNAYQYLKFLLLRRYAGKLMFQLVIQ